MGVHLFDSWSSFKNSLFMNVKADVLWRKELLLKNIFRKVQEHVAWDVV